MIEPYNIQVALKKDSSSWDLLIFSLIII